MLYTRLTIIRRAMMITLLISSCSINKVNRIKSTASNNNLVNKELYNIILFQDSLLFTHFNSRDFGHFQSFFSDSLEIYQDNTGLRNYRESMQAFKDLFSRDYVLTRKLIKMSVEVYPVKNYGAIETGQHTFCHLENGKPDCGTFKFVHIWKYANGQWKITRIITYDHKL